MRENSKDLAYGLIGTLKYEGILHLIKEGFRDRGSKQWKSKGTRRPEGGFGMVVRPIGKHNKEGVCERSIDTRR